MNTRKLYTLLRRNYRIAAQGQNQFQHITAVSALRELTGKWDAGMGGPFRRTGHQMKTMYYRRFADMGDDNKYAKFRSNPKMHGFYTCHTSNTLKWTLSGWDKRDAAEKMEPSIEDLAYFNFTLAAFRSSDITREEFFLREDLAQRWIKHTKDQLGYVKSMWILNKK